MNKLEKVKYYYSNRGFKFLLKKIFRFILFKLKKKKQIVEIQEDKLRVIVGEKGIKILYQGLELTNHHGINIAYKVLTQWHESSEASWEIIEVKGKQVETKIKWKTLPITHIWKVKVSNNKIYWKVKMYVEEEMEIEECKVGVLVSSNYQTWFNSQEDGEFPIIGNWEEVKFNGSEDSLIGVKDYKNKYESNFNLSIDFSNNGVDITPIVLNSSKDLNSRFLQLTLRYPNKFRSGWLDFFKSTISIGK